MADHPREFDDPRRAGAAESAAQQQDSPPTGGGKPLLIVAGVVGLVLVLLIGVVIGFVVRGRDSGVPTDASATTRQGPATYSMSAISNACDLVDLTPLTKWASAPRLDPDHEETPRGANFGVLRCGVYYGNSTSDRFPMNTAEVSVRADVMDGSAARKYDNWKRTTADLADKGSQVTSGEFTGIGTEGYWQYEADNFGGVVDAEYVVGVRDGGVAVQVVIDLSREKEAPAVDRDELDAVARSQARKVLDGLRDGNRSPAVAASSSAAAISSATATATPRSEPTPGTYSLNGITNACDLVDPTPLHKWSSTPDRAPVHRENPPSASAPGGLSYQVSYKSLAGNGVHWNQAAIDLSVEFTADGADPAYNQWKHKDTNGSGSNFGEITGIGTQGYWHTAASESSHTTGIDYVVGVQDSNASVRVRIPILRQHGEPPVDLDELGIIARNQALQALNGLKKK